MHDGGHIGVLKTYEKYPQSNTLAYRPKLHERANLRAIVYIAPMGIGLEEVCGEYAITRL